MTPARLAILTRSTLTLLAGLLLAVGSFAETPPTSPLPSIDAVLDKYVQAIGGRDAVLKAKTRVIKGTFEMPGMGLKGNAEVLNKAPNKTLTILDIPGFGNIQQGFNGKIGWSQDPLTGIRDLTETEIELIKRQADLHREVLLKSIYPSLAVKDHAKVGTTDTIVVEARAVPAAKPATGNEAKDQPPEKLFFATDSGLLIKAEFEANTPQGRIPFEVFLEDYRTINGVKYPFISRTTNSSFNILMKTEDVKVNVDVADSRFDKPKTP